MEKGKGKMLVKANGEKFIPSFRIHTQALSVGFVISGKKNFNSSTQILAPPSFHSLRKLSHENDSTIKTNLNWSGRNFLSFWLHFLTPHFLWILSKNLRHRAMNNSQVDIKSFFVELTTIFSSCGGEKVWNGDENENENFEIASNKYSAQFCGNMAFKMKLQHLA